MSAGLEVEGAAAVPAVAGGRLTLRPVPTREPLAAARVFRPDPAGRQPATQGTLALVLPERPELDAHETGGPERHDAPDEPRAWAATLVTAAIEIAAGLRSPSQLVRWTSLEVQESLTRRGALASRARRAAHARGAAQRVDRSARPAVRTVRLSSPREGVQEVTAVFGQAGRVRAAAMRMEGLGGRWRVTALDIG